MVSCRLLTLIAITASIGAYCQAQQCQPLPTATTTSTKYKLERQASADQPWTVDQTSTYCVEITSNDNKNDAEDYPQLIENCNNVWNDSGSDLYQAASSSGDSCTPTAMGTASIVAGGTGSDESTRLTIKSGDNKYKARSCAVRKDGQGRLCTTQVGSPSSQTRYTACGAYTTTATVYLCNGVRRNLRSQ